MNGAQVGDLHESDSEFVQSLDHLTEFNALTKLAGRPTDWMPVELPRGVGAG